VALVAIAGVMAIVSRSDAPARHWLIGGSALGLLYLASVAIITAFEPTGVAAHGHEGTGAWVRRRCRLCGACT
jgi:hypothetical protein